MTNDFFDASEYNSEITNLNPGLQFIASYDKKLINVRFNILSDFLIKLCSEINDDEESEQVDKVDTTLGLPFAEVINKNTVPLIVHLKFCSKEEFTINEEIIFKFTKILQNVVSNYFEINDKKLLIVTVEKSKWWSKNETDKCVSLRFIFPYTQININYQNTTLRNIIINEFSSFMNNDWEEIYQKIGNYILMYRGKEYSYEAPMNLCYVLNIDNANYLSDGEIDSSIFKPENYQYTYHNIIDKRFLLTKDPKFWNPLFLSINFSSDETQNKINFSSLDEDKDIHSKDPLIMIQYLLPMLSEKRFTMKIFWADIGQILYNITKGSKLGLDLFCKYSKNDNFECSKFYNNLRFNHLSIKTIAFYAKEDSPSKYKKYHNKWMEEAVLESFSLNDEDIAEVIYRMFWLEFICVNMEKDIWYYFNEHKLHKQDKAIDLRLKITNELVPFYKRLKFKFDTEFDGDKDEQVTQIQTLINKLLNYNRKTIYINASKEKFYIKDFNRLKDADPNKTGWENCVIITNNDNAYPVDGKLEDYITKTTGTIYDKNLTWNSPSVKKLICWLKQVFPDAELFDFFLKDISSFLYGRNSEKYLRTWSGSGDNSKSMIAKLLQLTLGDYCVDFPPSLLTGKARASSSPSPELAQAAGSHIAFVAETENDEKLREGSTKRFTGGDRFFARMLHENGGSIESSFKLIITCNKIPEFTSISKALKNRFVYIPFLSIWVDDPPENQEEQIKQRKFKKDPFFENQLPELAIAAAWVMVQYYTKYKTEKFTVPKIVEEYTTQHWIENDPIDNFISENIEDVYIINQYNEKIRDETKTLSATELYTRFTKWYKINYPGVSIMDQPTFKQHIINRYGNQHRKHWIGLQLKEFEFVPF